MLPPDLSPATLAHLTEQRDAAAAAHDYRTAAGLQDLLTVLTPRDLTLDDFSPPTLEGQTSCYMEHGFCVFPAAVQGAELQALQEAWLAAEAPAREGWQKRVAAAELKAAEEPKAEGQKAEEVARALKDLNQALALNPNTPLPSPGGAT